MRATIWAMAASSQTRSNTTKKTRPSTRITSRSAPAREPRLSSRGPTTGREMWSAQLPLLEVRVDQGVEGVGIRATEVGCERGHVVVEQQHRERQLVGQQLHHLNHLAIPFALVQRGEERIV